MRVLSANGGKGQAPIHLSNHSRSYYDEAFHDLTRTMGHNGRVRQFLADEGGQGELMTPLGNAIEREYDLVDRIIRLIQPDPDGGGPLTPLLACPAVSDSR